MRLVRCGDLSGIIRISSPQSFGLVVGQKDKISNANKPISPPIIKIICGLLDSGSCPNTPRPKNIRRLYPVNPAAPLTETRLEKILIGAAAIWMCDGYFSRDAALCSN